MKKTRPGIMLIIAACMTLLMGMNVFADGVPECPSGHTVGELAWEADYTECEGGYEKDVYACSVCNTAVYSDGTEAERKDGTGIHKAVKPLTGADYTECGH